MASIQNGPHQDGWSKSGTVGQEIYGAGNAFGILSRHYLQVPGEEFMRYIDYPNSGFTATKGKNIHFNILGDKSQSCRCSLRKENLSWHDLHHFVQFKNKITYKPVIEGILKVDFINDMACIFSTSLLQDYILSQLK